MGSDPLAMRRFGEIVAADIQKEARTAVMQRALASCGRLIAQNRSQSTRQPMVNEHAERAQRSVSKTRP